MSGATMLAMYRGLWTAAMPFITWYVRRKDLRRLVPSAVTAERFGHSKPPGHWKRGYFTLWIHGASVGECLSALPLVDLALSNKLKRQKVRVVVSTTTTAARQVMSERLKMNEDAVCVLAPLDHLQCVERFYEAWKPDVGIWVESEIWPTLITEAADRGIRLGLVNGRMSSQSFNLWRLPGVRGLSSSLLNSFSLVLCQDEQNRARFELLGARHTQTAPNLKFGTNLRVRALLTLSEKILELISSCICAASSRLMSDEAESAALRKAIRDRPTWVAASTHDDEEVMLAHVHSELEKRVSSTLLTVIIPRHPTRAPAILEQLQRQFPELSIALRSRDRIPTDDHSLFIVDTLGETCLFYDTIPTVVIGGSFVARGGHNPIEPLRAGCHVLMGPHMENFEDVIKQLEQQLAAFDALRAVSGPTELVSVLESRLNVDRRLNNSATNIANSNNSARLTRAMDELAVKTLSLHESQLLKVILGTH